MGDVSPPDPSAGITSLGPRAPEQDLRSFLAAALTASGYGDICLDEDRPPPKAIGDQWTGFLFFLVLSWAPALAARRELSLDWFWTGLLILCLSAAVLVLGSKWPKAFLAVLASWVAFAIFLWGSSGFVALAETYGVVVAFTLALYLILRARRRGLGIDPSALIRSVPFLFPLVLLLLFAPLITADLWRVASATTTARLVGLGVITVVPLAILLLRRLVGSLPDVIADTTAELALEPASAQKVHPLVERLLGPYEGSWVLNNGRTLLQLGFSEQSATEFSPFLAIKVRRPLSRALAIRTLIMLIGLGLCVFGYLYLLSAILVAPEIAAKWSGQVVPETTLAMLGLSVDLPGGPYLAITALLSIVALGAFFALITVEESYSRAMAEALLYEPVNDYLLLGLPYVRLRERKILDEAPTDQVGPFAASSAARSG
jgi:hypothetical protein